MVKKLFELLDKMSQNRKIGKAVTALSIAFFLLFVLVPLFFIFTKLGQFKYLPEMQDALFVSFAVAFLATIIDLLFGIPLAWLLSRKKFPLQDVVDTIIDLPLIIPTSALGLSVALFWSSSGVGLFGHGFELLVLLHVAFTFSYVVRTTQAAIVTIDEDLGRAARSLGASPFLSFRSVWLPLFRAGALSGAILAFTRSLGETGATLLAAGTLQTVPVLTVFYKNSTPPDLDAAISLSVILIVVSAILFLFMRSKVRTRKFSIGRIYADAERRVSHYSFQGGMVGLAAFALIVLLPSLYFLKFTDFEFFAPKTIDAISISFAIGIAATVLTMLFGLPFALYISSKKAGSQVFRLVNDLALLVPTVTIGISLSLFWAGKLDESILLVFTSISVIFPYFTSSVAEMAEGMDKSIVEVARSLGAKPFYAFRTVTLPLLMPTFIAGTLIAFMRSIAETGSTLAVSKTIVTIPILIVNESKAGNSAAAASAAVLLLAISVIVVLLLRSLQKKRRRDK